ncbi:hypothetical protein DBA29_26580 [Xenophilus aerolatus]|nr:hypothetical protein [Xenophilus aerolatus]
MKSNRRQLLRMAITSPLFFSAGAVPVLAQPAPAQTYPSRPVTLVVPYAAGGATDMVARLLTDSLRRQTGQAFVVDNRPGANGAIALEFVARAPADGYTVLVGNVATNAVLPSALAKKGKLDVAKSFVPVAKLASVPGVLVTTAKDFPPNNAAELIAYIRKNPGKVSYASAGNGSMAHLSFQGLAEQQKLDLIHVPYKGGPTALTDNISGLVHLNLLNVASAVPLINDGKLKAIAVSAPSRLEQLPTVPTMAELNLEGAYGGNWQGLFVRTGTPDIVVERLAAIAAAALASPDVQAAFKAANLPISVSASPKAFADFVNAEIATFRSVISRNNIEFD